MHHFGSGVSTTCVPVYELMYKQKQESFVHFQSNYLIPNDESQAATYDTYNILDPLVSVKEPHIDHKQ